MAKNEKSINYETAIYYRTAGWIEDVPANLKKQIERERNTYRKRMQRRGECACPRNKFNLCDTDCMNCPYHRDGIFLSLDAPVGEDKTSFLDMSQAESSETPETILAYKVLKERLEAMKAECTDEEKAILAGIEQDRSKREMAELLGLKPSTYQDRKTKLLKRLAEKHADLKGFLDF